MRSEKFSKLTTSHLRNAVENLKSADPNSDGNFIGIVHPLQALWIARRIHPWFFPENKELMEQTQADYDGYGLNDPAVDVRHPPKAVTPQRLTRGVLL